MTSSLFQEALADAKQLKEVAEQNARSAVIDAVTPTIRQFIEDQLLEGTRSVEPTRRRGHLDEDDDIDLATDSDMPVDATTDEDLSERINLMRAMDRMVEGLSSAESTSLMGIVQKMRINSAKLGSGGIPRAVPSDVRSTHIVKENAAMQGKKVYEVDLDELMSDGIGNEEEDEGMMMVPDDEGMHPGHYEENMHSGHHGAEDDVLEDADMDDEMDDEMADLYESLSALLEADDDAGDEAGDEEPPVDVKGAGGASGDEEEEEEEDEGEEGDEQATLDKIMALLQDLKAEVEDMKDGGAGAGSAMPPGADMGDDMAPPPAASAAPPPPGAKQEAVYRVNEASLMRELRKLREGKSHLGTGNKPAKKVAGALPEAYEEEDDEALLEVMDDEGMDSAYEGVKMGAMSRETKVGKFSTKNAGAYNALAKKVMQENRDLKVSLGKHSEAVENLRGQLTEMNLFNAKLLYVNRLLQDRDLTDGQRRNIIESLDGARSLREVKLLYKGLTESIGRNRSGKSKPAMVSESASRAVSATSRPLSTSGVRMNEAVEVQRWSILAGISKT